MPTIREIIAFTDDAPPPGSSPWVVSPTVTCVNIVDSDPTWPSIFASIGDVLCDALGARALDILHVGSTSVPGLRAKSVIDIDLIVADASDEGAWLPGLEKMTSS